MERKERRHHTRDFKLEAVRLAAVGDKTKAKVARESGVRVNQLRQWRLDFEDEERNGVPKQELATAEQDLGTLRRETDALAMAISRRGVPELVHSDRGSTYATSIYLELIRKHEIRQSMSRKGNCWDNAPMESFFHSLKTELVMHCDYKTRDQARASLFDYMEVFYNRQRRHSPINYVAPLAFEESTSV